MKLGVEIVLHNDTEFLNDVIQEIIQDVDKIFLIINDKPWKGTTGGNQKCLEYCHSMYKNNDKVVIKEGSWDIEHDHRNVGLDLCRQYGCDYCLIIDSDEIVQRGSIPRLRYIIETNPQYVAYMCQWDTLWKQKPLCVIRPRESFCPIICVNVNEFEFTNIRHGKSRLPGQQSALLPDDLFFIYHLSYARDDAYIKQKISTFMHAHEIPHNWYESVWMKWNPNMENIHPVSPSQYKKAVPFDISLLPERLRDKFLLLKETLNWQPNISADELK